MPATPMATSVMPCRQARPNESEITTATSTLFSSASASRSLAAEASGSYGKQADGFVAGNVRGVYARVGADETVVGLRDDDAAVHAYDAAALLSTTSIWRGSFP